MIIGGKRGCGKTTELIKIANERHLYIICASRQRVRFVADLSRKMKLDIPYPISIEELPLKSPFIKEVLVDDIEDVLSYFIQKPTYQASSSMAFKELLGNEGELNLNEILKYVGIIKQMLDWDYGKERVFYDSGNWYDRNACRNISLEELEKEVLNIIKQSERDSEYRRQLTDKIYELMGEEKAEQFLDSIDI